MKKKSERELVLCCATADLDKKKAGKVQRLLDGGIDWDYILADRSLACLTPLLFYNLGKITDRDTIPKSVLDTLRERYVGVLRRNTKIYRQLHEILKELQNEGIPVILLKGVALAETVYPDIALRPMSDIDLLVKKTDLNAVIEVLPKLGYIQPHSAKDYTEHHHIAPFRKTEVEQRDLTSIEIHHNISPNLIASCSGIDWLWENAQTIKIAKIDALALSPENLILHLCLHLSDCCFVNGIKTLVDISESIIYYGGNLNWDLLVRRSKELGVSNSVYHPLHLAKEMMDSDIPVCVLDDLGLASNLGPFATRFLKRLARKHIFKNWYYSPSLSRLIIFLYNSLCKELLYTTGRCNRIKNFGLSCVNALDRACRRHIKKEPVPQMLE